MAAPQFDGTTANWQSFYWRWTEFLKKISAGKVLDESAMLGLFEGCIPDYLRQELEVLRRQAKGKYTYSDFLGMLRNRFGQSGGSSMRKKWQNVTIPPHQGKLYRKTWKQFEMLFRQAWLDVPDVTDREAYQTLISKLPEFVMKYVRDANRDLQKTPVLFMKALPGYTQAEMAESIKIMTGKHPKKVEIGVGGTYMIQVENSSMSEKLLAFSGKKIAESTQEFEIQPVEQVVTLNELFQLVYDQLPEESENDRNQNQNPKGQSGTHNVEAKTKQKPEFDMSGTDRKNSGGKSSSAPQVFQTALGVQVVQVIRSSPPPSPSASPLRPPRQPQLSLAMPPLASRWSLCGLRPTSTKGLHMRLPTHSLGRGGTCMSQFMLARKVRIFHTLCLTMRFPNISPKTFGIGVLATSPNQGRRGGIKVTISKVVRISRGETKTGPPRISPKHGETTKEIKIMGDVGEVEEVMFPPL